MQNITRKKRRRSNEREREIKAARGEIVDRNGTVLATNRTVCTISVIHSQIKDQERVIEVLAEELELEPKVVRKRVEKVSSMERIKTNVPKEIGDKIREYDLAGVKVDEDFKRYYPYETMASQLFGYVGEVSEEELEELKQQDPNTLISGGTILGRSGLEKLYDSILRGTDGGKQVEVDATGRPVAEVR